MKESSAMKEIHEIRLKNYGKTKNMTREEKIKYINTKGENAKKRIEEFTRVNYPHLTL